jgi:undecaprenyl-diphosphatase
MTRSSADPAPARQRGNAGVPPGSLTPADDERAAFNRPVAAAPSPLTAGAVWLAAGLLLSGVAGAGVYVAIEISHVIDRARPPVADWAATAGGPSFPSIHTTAATLFAASCAWALTARARAGWPRRVIGAGALAYAAAVGLSRVWLGVAHRRHRRLAVRRSLVRSRHHRDPRAAAPLREQPDGSPGSG